MSKREINTYRIGQKFIGNKTNHEMTVIAIAGKWAMCKYKRLDPFCVSFTYIEENYKPKITPTPITH